MGAKRWAALLVLTTLSGVASGQERAPVSPLIPVAHAKHGFAADLAYRLRGGFTWQSAYDTGDRNLYYFLHWEELVPHNLIRRAGSVRQLSRASSGALGSVKAVSSLGEMTLDEMLTDARSRLQGFIVVHRGKILYEQYPGMREDDHHIWNSISKTIAGLLVGLLEIEGRIEVDQPIERYLPELARTDWRGVRVIDILDMATGLDLVENEKSRNDPATSFNQFWRIELGDTSGSGTRTADEILFAVKRARPAGEIFEYSSMNTKMLGLLAERISGLRLAELFSERVWSQIGAEGDAQVGVNLQGGAAIYGMVSSRLRDLARYGLLYTPSWSAVASRRIVPPSLLEKIQKGCRPDLYAASGRASTSDPASRPVCNSRQWDAVYGDGDIYKGSARGQGLYVSPARDVVIAWFGTTSESGWQNYARAISKAIVPSS
jgi:CubicO group peptidase (beta-lactamase class C family)